MEEEVSLVALTQLPPTEGRVGQMQCKNTSTNIKINIIPTKPSGSTIKRSELINLEEAEENYIQYNFMKMIAENEEEIKIPVNKWYKVTKFRKKSIYCLNKFQKKNKK